MESFRIEAHKTSPKNKTDSHIGPERWTVERKYKQTETSLNFRSLYEFD